MDKNSMRLDRAVDVHTAAYLVSNVTLCFLLFGRYVCLIANVRGLGASFQKKPCLPMFWYFMSFLLM